MLKDLGQVLDAVGGSPIMEQATRWTAGWVLRDSLMSAARENIAKRLGVRREQLPKLKVFMSNGELDGILDGGGGGTDAEGEIDQSLESCARALNSVPLQDQVKILENEKNAGNNATSFESRHWHVMAW